MSHNADRAQDMHPSDVEAVLDERDDLRRRLAIIRTEYERMKHNDDVLTQPYAESTAWMVAMDLWRAIKAAAKEGAMNVGDANAMRLCSCCGREGAGLYRLRDGRAVRVCRQCAWGCDGCRAWLNGATERKPIGREVEYGIPHQSTPDLNNRRNP